MATSLLARPARAADDNIPLHIQIDQLIVAATPDYKLHASERTSDHEFVRRIYLDLTGRIPSSQQVREFVSDGDPEKRRRLIDILFEGPHHVRHLQHFLDVLLMQRRPGKYIVITDWQQFLFSSVRANKPWDVLAQEILSADGADVDTRAAARFLLDRDLKTDETTRDLGRVFLGRDLQCAQCHDHPSIANYEQSHYFGLSAFLNRSYLFTDPKSKQKSIGEKAEGTVKFTSVFTSVEAETAPRMLNLPPLKDPVPDKEPYVAKPAKTTRGIPKYSRRLLLAKAVTDPANRAFRLNIANRLWAFVMGRGIVEPLDMIHDDNPPTHPKLLQLLADDLANHNYDMRRTLKEIVLSETYQRSSRRADDSPLDSQRYHAGVLKPLSPEQLAWSMMQATGVIEGTKAKVVAQLKADDPQIDLDSTETQFTTEALVNKELTKHVDEFVAIFASANESSSFDATAKQALFVLNGSLIGEWLSPTQNGLTANLLAINDEEQMIEQLFVSILARPPVETEQDLFESLSVEDKDDRKAVLKQAVRSLLASAEFRFNH